MYQTFQRVQCLHSVNKRKTHLLCKFGLILTLKTKYLTLLEANSILRAYISVNRRGGKQKALCVEIM